MNVSSHSAMLSLLMRIVTDVEIILAGTAEAKFVRFSKSVRPKLIYQKANTHAHQCLLLAVTSSSVIIT